MGMAWKEAIKNLKAHLGDSMQKEVEGLEESLKGWEARDESREKSFVRWRETDAKLRAEILDLRRLMGPYSTVEIALKARAQSDLQEGTSPTERRCCVEAYARGFDLGKARGEGR
jgi:hypothetical protein